MIVPLMWIRESQSKLGVEETTTPNLQQHRQPRVIVCAYNSSRVPDREGSGCALTVPEVPQRWNCVRR